jgi:hypothetical protein
LPEIPQVTHTDEELDAIQRDLGLGIPVSYIRDLLRAFRAEGDVMTDVRTAVALWAAFSESYCAGWLSTSGEMCGNFAGWLINSQKVKV